MVTTVSIITLGCKVNYTDSDDIAQALTERGYTVFHNLTRSALSIINTCTVTGKADYQSRQAVRRASKVSPGAPIIVIGCSAKIYPERFMREKNVAAVIPPDQRASIMDVVSTLIGDAGRGEQVSDKRITRTRAFLKIQEGCNAHCSYCIVPQARGREKSIMPDEVLDRIESLVCLGYREIVLTGIHLGRYGNDLTPRATLASLLAAASIRSLPVRIRLSSIEPMEVTDELLEVMASDSIVCPHLHVPLQSGDDEILSAMGRPYRSAEFRSVVTKVSERLTDPAIGLDVMVGFPGEGEDAFLQTMGLIQELPVTYLHVFPFSPRPGTTAATLAGQVDGITKKSRAEAARKLGNTKKEGYISRCVGKTLTVLVEEVIDGFAVGKSENYLEVYFPGDNRDINQAVQVSVNRPFRGGLYGERSV